MRRRWVLAALGGVAGGWLALYLLPPRNQSAMLELIALGADGRFAESISIPPHWAQTEGLGPGAVVRVPLILAVRNAGNQSAQSSRLELSLPTRYRLIRSDGRPLPAEYLPGTPMVRYRIDVPAMHASSGVVAGYLPVLDTLWLEPLIPSFYCIVLSDSVPDFVPSPPAPIEAISQVRIFYSFAGPDFTQRQTGLLAVQLDPALLKQETPSPPPIFAAEYYDPEAPRPPISTLEYVGSRQALCGDSQDPLEILSTLWETPGGGRFFVLDYGGAPRKYLFDLNRDSIIELEMWDAGGNGRFNARRPAQLPIPSFLMPLTERARTAPLLATLPEDQLLALDRYGAVLAEPYRFRSHPPDTVPRKSRFLPQTMTGDDDVIALSPGTTIRYGTDLAPEITPARHPNPATGQGQLAPASPPRQRTEVAPDKPPALGRPVAPRPGAPPPSQGGEQPTKPPPSDDASKPVAPKPARPSATEPKVLGKPLDSIPPRPRPDTTGRP